MRFFLVFAVLALTACTVEPQVSQRFDHWTGFSETITAEHEILRDGTAIMTVRGVMIARDGQRVYGVLTNLRRLVPNGPAILHMSSGTTRLDYRRHDRPLTHCKERCRRAETGAIVMSEQAFRMASQTGLPLRVQGRRGRYAATVPAILFQDILGKL
jgi:hypothetical protein